MTCNTLIQECYGNLLQPDKEQPFIKVNVTPHKSVLLQQWMKQNYSTSVLGRFSYLDDTDIITDDSVFEVNALQQVYLSILPPNTVWPNVIRFLQTADLNYFVPKNGDYLGLANV